MRRGHWLLLLAVLLVGGGLWLRSGKSADYANFPPLARGDWLAFGDSLTQGYGATEGHDYPTQLGQRLQVKIRNHGVPGNTTADGLARLDQALQPRPRVVLLCLGGNDGLRSVPAEQTFTNLGAMIDRCHQTGAFVVLLGVRSVGLTDKSAKRFAQLAKDKRVLLYTGGVKSWSVVSALQDLGMTVVATGTNKSTEEDKARIREIMGEKTKMITDGSPKALLGVVKEYQADILIAGGRNMYTALKARIPFLDINQEREFGYEGYTGMLELARQLALTIQSPVWESVRKPAPWRL